ncbi:MAG: hypothetical protein LBP83_08295 [Dysgonamonadaceae bacterium]|jgi:hypothetical protein|nr:hypothetical protein [Dysgonamonadaceae bacterium]
MLRTNTAVTYKKQGAKQSQRIAVHGTERDFFIRVNPRSMPRFAQFLI